MARSYEQLFQIKVAEDFKWNTEVFQDERGKSCESSSSVLPPLLTWGKTYPVQRMSTTRCMHLWSSGGVKQDLDGAQASWWALWRGVNFICCVEPYFVNSPIDFSSMARGVVSNGNRTRHCQAIFMGHKRTIDGGTDLFGYASVHFCFVRKRHHILCKWSCASLHQQIIWPRL